MSWFSGLFGTKEAVNNVVDKDNGLLVRAGGWFDGLQHTDQEKAEDRQKIRDWGIRQLEALAPFKVMQRIMVTIIMAQWAILGLMVMIGIWLEAVIDGFFVVDKFMAFAQTPFMWTPVLGAVTLYLMGGVIPRKGQS